MDFLNGGKLVESPVDLPQIQDAETLYIDFETSSGHPKKTSFNPWHNCFIAGLAITYDDCPTSWYIPDAQLDQDWLKDVLVGPKTWVNHNIKYDAHVLKNQRGLEFAGELYDTMTMAKLVYSDFFSYSLDNLGKVWLPDSFRKIGNILEAYTKKSKDYGDVPVEVMGEYACQDVRATRALHNYIENRMPDESRGVQTVEMGLTKVLFEIEQAGMCISAKTELELKTMEYKWGTKILNLQKEIEQELRESGHWDLMVDFEPHNNRHCLQLLIESYHMPVLKHTENGNPSFNKDTLAEYERLSNAPKELIKKIREFRKLWTLNNLFVEKYIQLNVDGKLHASYNQSVRTGRMSCSEPNLQQLDLKAKSFIIPDPGMAFVCYDYSQIEFRTIVHYIKNEAAILAYNEDPDTDFHQWVADLCHMPRRPAKNINFMLGYGGGKKKTLAMLSASEELVDSLKTIATTEEEFRLLSQQKALDVYQTYHRTLPELKSLSRIAQSVIFKRANSYNIPENTAYSGKWKRGYVTNIAGRRRYLPAAASYRAFNSLNQSTAADIMKERVVALHAFLKDAYSDVMIRGVVHDEVVLCGPEETLKSDAFHKGVSDVLEASPYKLRVPLKCSRTEISSESWAGCGK